MIFGLYRQLARNMRQNKRSSFCKTGFEDITCLCRITNLLDNLVDLVDCQLDDGLIHPFSDFQGFDETVLDVVNDLVAKIPRFSREGLLDEKATQDPTKTVVNVTNTGPPSFLGGIWFLVDVSISKLDSGL